jgi:hypothetical protein
MTRLPGKERQERTGGKGQPVQDSQDKTAKTGQPGDVCLDRPGRSGYQLLYKKKLAKYKLWSEKTVTERTVGLAAKLDTPWNTIVAIPAISLFCSNIS